MATGRCFQSQMFWELFFHGKFLRVEVPDVGFKSFALQGELGAVSSLPFVVTAPGVEFMARLFLTLFYWLQCVLFLFAHMYESLD